MECPSSRDLGSTTSKCLLRTYLGSESPTTDLESIQLVNQMVTIYCIYTFFIKSAILLEFVSILLYPSNLPILPPGATLFISSSPFTRSDNSPRKIRLFAPQGRPWMWWASYALIFANLVCYTVIVVVINIACHKIVLGGACTTVFAQWSSIMSSVVNFVTDILILFIPQHSIWNLKMSFRKKVGVAGVFLIGISGTIAAGLRMGYTVQAYTGDQDFTYVFSNIIMCCISEGCCAFLVICGPTLPRALGSLGIHNPLSSDPGNSYKRKPGNMELSSWGKNPQAKSKRLYDDDVDLERPGSRSGIMRTTEFETTVSGPETRIGSTQTGVWNPDRRQELWAGYK